MGMGNRLAGRRPCVHAEVHPVDSEFLREVSVEVDGHCHELLQLVSAEGEEVRFMATRDNQSVARAQWIGVRKRCRQVAARRQLSMSDPFAKWAPIGLHRLEARTDVGLDVE